MKGSKYTITAFNANGSAVHTEGAGTIAQARKTARQFLPYTNVYTVDVTRNNQLAPVTRFVKLTPNTGVSITDGITTNVRF